MNTRALRPPSESLSLGLQKLLEVDYFGTLIRYVAECHVGLTPLPGHIEIDIFPGGSRPHRTRPVEEQLSYLLSAFLNAAYSTVEYLKQEPLFREACNRFVVKHKYLYGSGPNGGLRTRNTHFAHVTPAHKGRLVPVTSNGAERLFKIARRMKLPVEFVTERSSLDLNKYYIDRTEPQDDIATLSSSHYFELSALISECKLVTSQILSAQ